MSEYFPVEVEKGAVMIRSGSEFSVKSEESILTEISDYKLLTFTYRPHHQLGFAYKSLKKRKKSDIMMHLLIVYYNNKNDLQN